MLPSSALSSLPLALLLIEDDPSIRRFVALALEELPVELHAAASLAEARQRLSERPWGLIVCDLMLPDGSALTLLADPAARAAAGSAPWAMMSAGLTPERRTELAALGVTVCLDKPVSLATLEAAVQAVLQSAGPDPRGSDAKPAADPTADGPPAPRPPPADAPWPPAQAEALARHFGGDAELFGDFRRDVLRQLPQDAAEGDLACQRQDAAGLRRVAHSLKSVLTLIGEPELSLQARALEDAAATPATAAAAFEGWPALAQALRRLVAP
jgi:DNA-binding response OmpR family regulator